MAQAVPSSALLSGLRHHAGDRRNWLYMVAPEVSAIRDYWRSRHPGGVADCRFESSERQMLWEALTQDMTARAKELVLLEADEKARNRETRKILDTWKGDTLESLAREAIERELLAPCIPGQPDRGILLHGVRVYGQGD